MTSHAEPQSFSRGLWSRYQTLDGRDFLWIPATFGRWSKRRRTRVFRLNRMLLALPESWRANQIAAVIRCYPACNLPHKFGMQENPERSGTERNGTEPEVVINVSSCTTNFAQYYTLDRENSHCLLQGSQRTV